LLLEESKPGSVLGENLSLPSQCLKKGGDKAFRRLPSGGLPSRQWRDRASALVSLPAFSLRKDGARLCGSYCSPPKKAEPPGP